MTRATVQNPLLTQYGINTSDMDPSSPLVKILNAMNDHDVVVALQNNNLKEYLFLLDKKGLLPNRHPFKALKNTDNILDEQQSYFVVYGVAVAVVAVAWAGVVASVVVIGPSTDPSSSQDPLYWNAIDKSETVSFDLSKTDNDPRVNKLIDDAIEESANGLYANEIELMKEVAKSAYFDNNN